MCGIAGYAGRPPKGKLEVFRAFMDALLVETQSRGSHATGIAAYLGGTKSIVGKGPVDAKNFINTPVWDKSLAAKSLIGHCRYATHGSPGKNENNHPFEQGRWALVHNGVVSDYRRIEKAEGVHLTSECDSEIILRVVAKGAGKEFNARKGIQRWVDAVPYGNRYACSLLDRSNGLVRLFRDGGSPCAILRLPRLGIVAFASTKEILAQAYDQTFVKFPDTSWGEDAESWDCLPYKVYVLDPETIEVEHEELTTRGGAGTQELWNRAGFSSDKPAPMYRDPKGSTGVWEGSRTTSMTQYACEICGELSLCRCGM